ncbi:hypothetical protein, partial [Prosthecobacter sp.]|uniref:hypothetical protein n=1 Tax=Prosthecobacter sp. TaxID=1965333 RepID=UPI0037832193
RGDGQNVVIGKRAQEDEATVDRRFPWVPTILVATGVNGLPNVPPASTDFYTSYVVEASPAPGLFRETYGVDHFYYLVIEIVGPLATTEVFADSVQTGSQFDFVSSSFVLGSGETLTTTAALYVDSGRGTVVATATHIYTAA